LGYKEEMEGEIKEYVKAALKKIMTFKKDAKLQLLRVK
jgi:hypothetical protein